MSYNIQPLKSKRTAIQVASALERAAESLVEFSDKLQRSRQPVFDVWHDQEELIEIRGLLYDLSSAIGDGREITLLTSDEAFERYSD